MNEEHSGMPPVEQAPRAQVRTKRTFSIVWVVPIVALAIGGWLAFKAWSEKGPEIKITFESADGLEANKTKIKFKDVEIGIVTAINLKDNLSGVVVTAEMKKDTATYINDKTQFWVVRARVAAGEVSGLGTLFSGAYIGCNPSTEGKPTRQFTGLEKPPVVTYGVPGRQFLLTADSLGSLEVGSPVYYRGIKAGQVIAYDFDNRNDLVNLTIFVNSPYDEKVLTNSRFWNASGIDVNMGAEGVKIDTQSMISIMLGGVAFDLPDLQKPGQAAEQNQVFTLYKNRESAQERTYAFKKYYMLYFDQNVRGLNPGAPVEIMGIKLGEVVDIKLELNTDDLAARVAVLIMIEPQRVDTVIENNTTISGMDRTVNEQKTRDLVNQLAERGLRAQLKTGSLLTGQLYVDLNFYKDAPPAQIGEVNGYPVFPTIPAPLEQIVEKVRNILDKFDKAPLDQIVVKIDSILDKFNKFPIDQIGGNLQEAVAALTRTLEEVKNLSGNVNRETLPQINTALAELQKTLQSLDGALGSESSLTYNISTITDDLSATLRSVRSLVDYLERNPQALIFGKEENKP
jgi:paraquat-inducible protein B